MRVSCSLLVVTAAFYAASAGATSLEQATKSKTIRGSDSNRFLRSEALHELPERLEEYVENHHLIRHILWWCQEEMEPDEVMKEAKPGSEKEEAALIYKELLDKQHKTGRKLIQCGVAMRVLDALIIFTTALLAMSVDVSAAETTGVSEDKMIKDVDSNKASQRFLRNADSIHEERDEHLDGLVEKHRQISELFSKWCLEGKTPEQATEEAEPGSEDEKVAELYKKFYSFHTGHGVTGRKLAVLECSV